MISFADNTITINIDETSIDGKSVFMKATTNGGVSSYKQINVIQIVDPCIYQVTPQKGSITFAYTEGQNVEVGNQLKGIFTFKNGDGCLAPID